MLVKGTPGDTFIGNHCRSVTAWWHCVFVTDMPLQYNILMKSRTDMIWDEISAAILNDIVLSARRFQILHDCVRLKIDHMSETGTRLDIQMSYQYKGSHCKDKTVVGQSYLYNWNPRSWKDRLSIETDPKLNSEPVLRNVQMMNTVRVL